MPDDLQVPLATAIEALRGELEQAMDAGKAKDLRFVLGPIDLTLELELARTGGVSGGVEAWVISLGGKKERTSTTTHTIRLSLSPVSKGGEKTLVADEALSERPR